MFSFRFISTKIRSPRRVTRGTFAVAAAIFIASCTVSGLGEAVAGEKVERRVTVGGQTRSYTAYLPSRRSSGDLRVLIAFHPALADGAFMERSAQLHRAPGAENFIVVYPNGVRRTWNAGDCCGLAEKMNVDDLGFFDAMMKDLDRVASIKPKAYVTGYSNGALMVYQLACKRPDQIAAAAPFAAYLPPKTLQRCPNGRVPLMHMHGDSDDGAPVEGGQTRYLGYLPPVIDTVDVMAKRNGCSVSQTGRKSVPELDTTCTTFSGCSGGAETMLCVIPGLGHAWPGMQGRPGGKFGPARADLEGSEAVIEFFMRH